MGSEYCKFAAHLCALVWKDFQNSSTQKSRALSAGIAKCAYMSRALLVQNSLPIAMADAGALFPQCMGRAGMPSPPEKNFSSPIPPALPDGRAIRTCLEKTFPAPAAARVLHPLCRQSEPGLNGACNGAAIGTEMPCQRRPGPANPRRGLGLGAFQLGYGPKASHGTNGCPPYKRRL
jgi:hypothetical protein